MVDLEKQLEKEVERLRERVRKQWQRDTIDHSVAAKWLSVEQEAIFSAVCCSGECEQRSGTNTAPCFMTAREFASKNYRTCPHCDEGDLEVIPWETMALSITEWDIYQRKYEEKLEQIRKEKSVKV